MKHVAAETLISAAAALKRCAGCQYLRKSGTCSVSGDKPITAIAVCPVMARAKGLPK